jgi:hypothetical protein
MSDIWDRREALKASPEHVDQIVIRLLADVTDRRGWRHEWDNFDEDVQHEILDAWSAIVRSVLGKPEPTIDARTWDYAT